MKPSFAALLRSSEPSVRVSRRAVVYNMLKLTTAALVAALAIISLVVWVHVSNQTSNRARCTRLWADSFSARYTLVVSASNTRNDALDAFVRSLATNDKATEVKAFTAYLAASDQYKKTQAANPIPSAPQYACK